MTTYKFNGNKRLQADFKQIFGEYGSCSSHSRKTKQAAACGTGKDAHNGKQRQAQKPPKNSQENIT